MESKKASKLELDWLEARRHGYGLGASDSPAILGVSAYAGPWRVWAQHKAPHLIKSAGQIASDGRSLEPAVVKMYSDRSGLELVHHDWTVYSHPRIKWLRMSPDATTGPIDFPTGHYEVKVVFSAVVAPKLPPSGDLILSDFPIQAWAVQALHQLAAVPTLEHVTIVALLPWFELRTYRLERGSDGSQARKAIANLAIRLRDFRDRYLVGDEVPPIDDSSECSRYADWKNPAPEDWQKKAADRPTREATEAEAASAYAYLDAKNAQAKSTSEAKIARNHLLDGIGDAYRLILPCGGSVKVSSHQQRRITVKDQREQA